MRSYGHFVRSYGHFMRSYGHFVRSYGRQTVEHRDPPSGDGSYMGEVGFALSLT